MKHIITINTTEKQEQLIDYLCRYHGTTSGAKLLELLLQEKLKEELEKNRADLKEFYEDNKTIPKEYLGK